MEDKEYSWGNMVNAEIFINDPVYTNGLTEWRSLLEKKVMEKSEEELRCEYEDKIIEANREIVLEFLKQSHPEEFI